MLLRGEGPTETAAADAAWQQHERATRPGHEHRFVARTRGTADGVCTGCGIVGLDSLGAADLGIAWSSQHDLPLPGVAPAEGTGPRDG